MEKIKEFTFQEWLEEGRYWQQMENALTEVALDHALLQPHKPPNAKGWGCMIPQAIITKAKGQAALIYDMFKKIGHIEAELIDGIISSRFIINEKYKETAIAAKQFYKQQIEGMEVKNRHFKRLAQEAERDKEELNYKPNPAQIGNFFNTISEARKRMTPEQWAFHEEQQRLGRPMDRGLYGEILK